MRGIALLCTQTSFMKGLTSGGRPIISRMGMLVVSLGVKNACLVPLRVFSLKKVYSGNNWYNWCWVGKSQWKLMFCVRIGTSNG